MLIISYAAAVFLVLCIHGVVNGMDAAGATAIVAVTGGFVMAAVAALWEWCADLLWLHLGK